MHYRILATLSFFTRLPFWKLCDIPAQAYQRVVPLWPLAGWLTGGVMMGVFAIAIQFLSIKVAIILALVARALLTGGLHEDGFADFCDGFGGGTSKERTLEIMKDSHIGTYGVLGLVFYYILLYNVLVTVVCGYGIMTFLVVDCIAKFVSSTIIWWLPYARTAETAKNRLVYSPVSVTEKLCGLILGALPFLLYCTRRWEINMLWAFLAGIVIAGCMQLAMKKRIGGYTGDCCGATFIVTELTIYIILSALG